MKVNNLYYVPVYHRTANEWERLLVTAQTQDEAVKEVEKYIEGAKGLRMSNPRFICTTTDDLLVEI